MDEATIVLRLAVAALVGGLVGLEREMRGKPAGMRTHALVCMGAALFATLSGSPIDPSYRIASNVVVGVGFLGAGMILRTANRVVGLTTAAEVWALAAIGLAIGLGYYIVTMAGVALLYTVLFPAGIVERKLKQRVLAKEAEAHVLASDEA
ncbi:MAG: magnesium transporter MgtC [Nitrososphaerota archaeon]